jgi:hypothetical protein
MDRLIRYIIEQLKKLVPYIEEAFRWGVERFRDFLSWAKDNGSFGDLVQAMLRESSTIFEKVKEAGQNVGDAMGRFVDKAAEVTNRAAQKFVEAVSRFYHGVVEPYCDMMIKLRNRFLRGDQCLSFFSCFLFCLEFLFFFR